MSAVDKYFAAVLFVAMIVFAWWSGYRSGVREMQKKLADAFDEKPKEQ